MREIKFRMWDIAKQEWNNIYRIDKFPSIPQVLRIPTQVKIQEYIGAKDENDKEIYEGDLIECVYCHKENGEVYWNKEMFRFELKWEGKDCGNARHTRMDCSRVVGNIYQNPKLKD